MPKPMEFAQIANRFVTGLALVVSMAALALILASRPEGSAQAAPDTAEFIVTGNTDLLFPVITRDASLKDSALELERLLRLEREKAPQALLIDAGNSVSVTSSMETSYTYRSAQLFNRMDYSVVNLSARDALFSTAIITGYRYAPRDFGERLISNLKSNYSGEFSMNFSRSLDSDDHMPLAFFSLSSLRAVSGITGLAELMEEVDLDIVKDAIADARAEGRTVVGFSSLTDAQRADLLAKPETSPDVLVDFRLAAGAKPVRQGASWRIPPPPSGEFLHLKIKRDAAGGIEAPAIRPIRYMTPANYKSLVDYNTPEIGIEIPNLTSVSESLLGQSSDRIRIDRMAIEPGSRLSTLPQAVVYATTLDEKPVRIYRMRRDMSDARTPDSPSGTWPNLDMLVVVNENGTINRVLSRHPVPLSTFNTSMIDALNKLKDQPPATWTPDPVLAAGMEDIWDWATDALERTIQLDAQLYGAPPKP